MLSPLPDSRDLEAGIVEDASPSRLSRVHDNVRDLLRRSVFGSANSSPMRSTPRSPWGLDSPTSPILPHQTHPTAHSDHQTIPIESIIPTPNQNVPGVLFPPWRPRPTMLNHTIRPHEHPDLPPSTLSAFLQQKDIQRQQKGQEKAWKRPPKTRKQRKTSSVRAQWPICAILAVILLGLLGTCKHHTIRKTRNKSKLAFIANFQTQQTSPSPQPPPPSPQSCTPSSSSPCS